MKNLGYANGWGGYYIDKDGNQTDSKNGVSWRDKEVPLPLHAMITNFP
jgi:hypothetical protein